MKKLNDKINYFYENCPQEISWGELKEINWSLWNELREIARELFYMGRVKEEDFPEGFLR